LIENSGIFLPLDIGKLLLQKGLKFFKKPDFRFRLPAQMIEIRAFSGSQSALLPSARLTQDRALRTQN